MLRIVERRNNDDRREILSNAIEIERFSTVARVTVQKHTQTQTHITTTKKKKDEQQPARVKEHKHLKKKKNFPTGTTQTEVKAG